MAGSPCMLGCPPCRIRLGACVLIALMCLGPRCAIASPNTVQVGLNIGVPRANRSGLGAQEQLLFRSRQHQEDGFSRSGIDDPGADTQFEWSGRTVAAAIAAAVCALLANAAGLGGGPFYVSLFNVGLGFDLKLCTGLSHTMVAVGAISSSLAGLVQRSPVNPTSSLLNFDLAMILVPAMLFGTSIGVTMGPLAPEWLQTLLLSLLLVAVTQKTFFQGVQKWRQERASAAAATAQEPLLAAEAGGSFMSPLIDPDAGRAPQKQPAAVGNSHATAASLWQRIPYWKAAALAAMWLVFVALQLQKAEQPHCSWAYAGLALTQAVFLASSAATFAYIQAQRAQHDPASVDSELRMLMMADATAAAGSSGGGNNGSWGDGSSHAGGAFAFSPNKLLGSVAVVAAAGLIAGLLGVAGAFLFSPYLLSLGVHPQVVASSALLVMLYGSSSISLSFWFNGMLNISYLKVFAPITFVASLVGVTACGWAIRRSGRPSVLVLLMSVMLAAGMVAVVVFGGQRTVEDIRDGRRVTFNGFCEN